MVRDLVGVAEQLRAVREAERRFFWRWHFEDVFVGPDVLDQVAADVERVPPGLLAALTDPVNGLDALHFRGPMVDEP